jgi:predicted deacylase
MPGAAEEESGLYRVKHVKVLDLDEVPSGREVRLMVELVRDSLGRAMRVPVTVLKGLKPGPVVGIVAALHGNELNGIRVIHELFDRLDVKKLRGTIVAINVANVPGYIMHQREFMDGTDLNHIMPGKEGGNEAQVYAYRLFDRIVQHFDFMLDLHTASFGRINSLYIRADMTHPQTARMAYLQRPQIILHNPPADPTLRGSAMEHGIPSITIEIGNPHLFQNNFIQRSLLGLRGVLMELGVMPRTSKLAAGADPIICRSSLWLYTTEGGILEVFPDVVERVEKDQLIAQVRNIFGDIIQKYYAPHDGIVIGKSTDPAAQTGARILHLGQVAEPEELAQYYRRELTTTLATRGDSSPQES